jgi:type IV secretory pathway TraG/TraD family ATPase VirD4
MNKITNLTIRQAPHAERKPLNRWQWMTFILVWCLVAQYTYITHPFVTFLPTMQRALLATLGIILYPIWPFFAEVWQQVVSGASRWQVEQFALIYVGTAIAVVGLPVGLYRFWLTLPASMRRQTAFRIQQHRHAQGQLNAKESVETLALVGNGLPLAQVRQKRRMQIVGVSAETLEGHCLVVGPTRSGKGMHLTETLLTYRGAAVVVDPKSEQYERTAGYREQLGPIYRLPEYTLDLSTYFDMGNRDDVAELHYHLLKPWADKQPIFAEKCKSLFTAANAYAGVHHLNPLQVLLDAAESDPTKALTALMSADENAVMAFTNGRKPDSLDRFSASAWGTFATRLYEYQQHWQTVTTFRPTVSIPPDWAAQNATIYITYRFDQLKGVGGLVSAIISALLRHQVRHNLRDRALIAVDELPTLGLRNVTDYLAHVGGYNLSMLLYAQTYSQLSDLYGERGAETMLSNCQHQVWYPPVSGYLFNRSFQTETHSPTTFLRA